MTKDSETPILDAWLFACRDLLRKRRGIEITPAMVETGVKAYLDADRMDDPPEQVIREIYEAMEWARNGSVDG